MVLGIYQSHVFGNIQNIWLYIKHPSRSCNLQIYENGYISAVRWDRNSILNIVFKCLSFSYVIKCIYYSVWSIYCFIPMTWNMFLTCRLWFYLIAEYIYINYVHWTKIFNFHILSIMLSIVVNDHTIYCIWSENI